MTCTRDWIKNQTSQDYGDFIDSENKLLRKKNGR